MALSVCVGLTVGAGISGAAPAAANETTVVVAPESVDDLETGETSTAEILIEDAEGGVGAFEATIAVANASVVSIATVTVPADGDDGPYVETDRAEDGSEITVSAALLDATLASASDPVVANVTLVGDAPGTTEIEVTAVEELTDANNDPYDVEGTTAATVSVEPGGSDTDVSAASDSGSGGTTDGEPSTRTGADGDAGVGDALPGGVLATGGLLGSALLGCAALLVRRR